MINPDVNPVYLTYVDTGEKFYENKITFKTFYYPLPKLVNEIKEPTGEPKVVQAAKPDTSIPKVDKGIDPKEFYDQFMNFVKDMNVEFESIYNEKENTTLIKFNGYNIFKICANRNRFWVQAHPNSLTPALKSCDAYQRTAKKYSQKRKVGVGTALRSKFIFTKWSERGIMKALVNAGFDFRREYDLDYEDYKDIIKKTKKINKEND